MKSIASCVSLRLWLGLLLLTHTAVTMSIRSSYSTFMGVERRWMHATPLQRQNAQLAVKIRPLKLMVLKKPIVRMVAEDIDGAELLDDEEYVDNFVWTPERDAKLLSELKRLKRLRWYKVAKLMGEGATARNCHGRWRELVWPDSFNIATIEPVPTNALISDGWEDDEVSKLVSAVDCNTNKDDSIDWNKVALTMGFESSVCEEKYNKLLAAEAKAEADDSDCWGSALLSGGTSILQFSARCV